MIDVEAYEQVKAAAAARRDDERKLAAFHDWAAKIDAENARRTAAYEEAVAKAATGGDLPPARPELLPKDAPAPFDETTRRRQWRAARLAALAAHATEITADVEADLARIDRAAAPLRAKLAALDTEAENLRGLAATVRRAVGSTPPREVRLGAGLDAVLAGGGAGRQGRSDPASPLI